MSNEIKFAGGDSNLLIDPEPHTITFHADEILISADRVCLGFEDMPFNLKTIKTLEFKNLKGDKTFTYVRKD